jgi:hypothetical protein
VTTPVIPRHAQSDLTITMVFKNRSIGKKVAKLVGGVS